MERQFLNRVFVASLIGVLIQFVACQHHGPRTAISSINQSGVKGMTTFSRSSKTGIRRENYEGIHAAQSMELAIVPLEDGKKMVENAIFIRSGTDGRFQHPLPPGDYWVGPKNDMVPPSKPVQKSSVRCASGIAKVEKNVYANVLINCHDPTYDTVP